MTFLVDTAMDILKGTPQKRNLALVTTACWFAMGAFITSTVSFYVPFGSISHGTAVFAGGAVAACVAGCLKAA